MNLIKYSAFLIFLFILAGCASRPPKVELPANWSIKKHQLQQFTEWQLRARLAYKNNDDSFSASMVWNESPQSSQIRLLNPLGISLVSVDVNTNMATLEADGEIYQGDDINSLLYQITGWDIPVSDLRYWIIGLPQEDDTLSFYENGSIKRLYPHCDGCEQWQIDFLDYTEHQGLVLPRSLVISNLSKENTFIKLRVSSWR
jgi:outer membrane lipoprotein LolB